MSTQHRVGMTRMELGIVAGVIFLLIGLLLPYVQQAREAERRSSWKNNLKQLGIALHSYHETHGCFPPGGTIREDDTAMHGWMMMLMPFMDASPYYDWIDKNKSWDNPYNGYVLNSSIPSYMIPGVDENFTTSGFGLTHIQGNPNIFSRNCSVSLRQINEGFAHKWMLGEVAGDFQPWGYPFNWRNLGTKLCDGPDSFGRPVWHGVHLLQVDGRVSFYSDQSAPEILRSLATAPPVATQEKTVKPATLFQTGNFHWKRVGLYSDPKGPNVYFANVLKKTWGTPLAINLFSDPKLTPEQLNYPKTWKSPRSIAQIDASTDITKALRGTPLFNATSSGQFQANVKTLRGIQKQLP